MRDVMSVRKANLKLLIEQWGGPSNLAQKLGYSGPSYVLQMLGNHRPITEKTARKIEEILELPLGWLDQEQKNSVGRHIKVQPALVNTDLIFQIIDTVTTVLEEEQIDLSKLKFRDIVTMVYEEALVTGTIDEGRIRRIVRIAK